jgi:hypothetical protein
MYAGGQLPEIGRSVTGDPAEAEDVYLDRLSLLSAPPAERTGLLQDYLSGLVASACGIDAAKVAADVPLTSLGIDSSAAVGIQQSIQVDLGAHLTASDLAHALSLADLAARLDSQLSSGSSPGQAASPSAADEAFVRLYRWVSGSRVPGQADSDPRGPDGCPGMRSRRMS